MRLSDRKYVFLSLLVLLSVAFPSGCIAPVATKPVEQPLLSVTPGITQDQATAAPQSAFGSQTGMTTAHLSHGVSLSYPVSWSMEQADVKVLRDYGRNVINIANFRSPLITSDREYAAAPNPDKSAHTQLSVDIDPDAAADFERYFNLATLAIQNRYGEIEITKRNVVLKLSVTNTFPAGYKSYELDFDTKSLKENIRGKYIFTNVDGTIYIFAFRNPSPWSKEIEQIYKSVIITPAG